MQYRLLLLAVVLLGIVPAGASGDTTRTSRQRNPKLTVHFVPHTHDDVGWLKTVDQYHYGANNSLEAAGTRYIISSIVEDLLADPDRKFTYVEMAFFYRWWNEQLPNRQEEVRQLVRNGQLHFANGGWCMHDEANPHYIDMIDQTTLGHRFLRDEFDYAPRVGWQTDPFGHSSTQVALISHGSGFDATFHSRIDYQDYAHRAPRKELEFNWAPSPSLGPTASVYGGVMFNLSACAPDGLDFDVGAGDYKVTPVQDDKSLHDYNVGFKVNETLTIAFNFTQGIPGSDVMIPMGCDFNYESATMWYQNMDKLIYYLNKDGRVHARYSTPHEYAAAKIQLKNTSLSTKTDDFFPYADAAHSFWTGYFTSRPALKRYVRDMSSYHQASRQISAIAGNPTGRFSWLAQAMGLAQHHDAVAGTEKQHVAFDYAQRIAHGVNADEPHLFASLSNLTGAASFSRCPLANVSLCPATQKWNMKADLTAYVWNSLARPVLRAVEIPVPTENIVAVGAVDSVVVTAPHPVTNYRTSNPAAAPFVLHATVSLPALGYTAIRLQTKPAASRAARSDPRVVFVDTTDSTITIQNQFLVVEFSSVRKSMTMITNKASGVAIGATQRYCWYQSNTGDAVDQHKSGAYLFRPTSNQLCSLLPPTSITVVSQTPTLAVIEQTFGRYVSQRLTLRSGARNFGVEFTVGPLPSAMGGPGTEVVYRFDTNISSAATWYTDSNGREMQKRRRNFRPTWKLNQTEPVAGNYYPVNALAILNDTAAQLSVAVDASVGGSSINDGQLELMIHRGCLVDDGKGVGEPLNETEHIVPYWKCGSSCGKHYGPGLIIRGRHVVSLDHPATAMDYVRPMMDEVYAQPRLFFSTAAPPSTTRSFAKALPENVQLTTLELVNATTLLVRLSHQFAVGESPTMSEPVTVDLRSVLPGAAIVQVDEMNLSANTVKRTLTKYEVTLSSMSVMTYVVRLAPPKKY